MRDEVIEIPKARQAAAPCPRCGHIFEVGFTIEGIRFGGHKPGGPTCVIPQGEVVRDARVRRLNRRGQ